MFFAPVPVSRALVRRPSAFVLLGAFVTGALLFVHAGCGEEQKPSVEESHQVRVQVLAFNDFHGNLEPPSGSSGRIRTPDKDASGAYIEVNAGGASYLAGHIAKLREENPNTVVVSAGDLVGASPLVSALFHDEPTVEVMNQVGLAFSSVGNHEFDEGFGELLRLQAGGCHPKDGCQDGTPFPGAKFQYLAANVFTDVAGRRTVLPPYGIREFEGIKVAFIGMTLEGTPQIVNPSGVAGLSFQDEADTVNALVPELKAQGVEAIVVLLHEGGFPSGFYNECPGISGPIVDIVNRLDSAVDLVITGHTHEAYNCVINGRHVTSGANYGRLLTDVDLVLETKSRDVVDVTARNVIVTRDTPNAAVDSFVKDYVTQATPLQNRVIGSTPVELKAPPRTSVPAGTSGESTLGNVIADAMLEATRDEKLGAAVLALVNPGGVRADINAGDITYGEAFTAQPFTNNLTTLTLTGAQIERVLEQQFRSDNTARILQVSQGFSYAWKASAPVGEKVDPASIKLNGVVIDPAASYRVTTINFLAAGGDGFTVLAEGTQPLTGAIDLDALEAYLVAHNPLPAQTLGRITAEP